MIRITCQTRQALLYDGGPLQRRAEGRSLDALLDPSEGGRLSRPSMSATYMRRRRS